MAAWKQLPIAIVVLLAATGAWARFFPGASEIMARWGMDWAVAAVNPDAGPAVPTERRSGQGGRSGQQTPTVVAAEVDTATINDKLSAIGTGRAANSVVVNPYSSGRLTQILARSGDAIRVGDLIARLDADVEEIARDRARIALDDAEARLKRTNALRTANTASAVQVTDAELALGNARLALRDAELALERRSILAPIAGVVGIIPVEAGNHVTTDTAIATIDDRSKIKVDFWVPERFAGAVSVDAPVRAVPIARPNEVLDGRVSAIDNRLDEKSRTLLVQAEIENPRDTLRAGMSFQVTMSFPGDTFPAVNPLAVQWSTDGAYVWAVRKGKATRTPVRIIQRNTDSVLVQAELVSGDEVVTEGIHSVREGAEVMIAGRKRPEADPAAAASIVPAAAKGGT